MYSRVLTVLTRTHDRKSTASRILLPGLVEVTPYRSKSPIFKRPPAHCHSLQALLVFLLLSPPFLPFFSHFLSPSNIGNTLPTLTPLYSCVILYIDSKTETTLAYSDFPCDRIVVPIKYVCCQLYSSHNTNSLRLTYFFP